MPSFPIVHIIKILKESKTTHWYGISPQYSMKQIPCLQNSTLTYLLHWQSSKGDALNTKKLLRQIAEVSWGMEKTCDLVIAINDLL